MDLWFNFVVVYKIFSCMLFGFGLILNILVWFFDNILKESGVVMLVFLFVVIRVNNEVLIVVFLKMEML